MTLEETFILKLLEQLDSDEVIGIGLTGSSMRGQAQQYSDIDLWRFVKTPPQDRFATYTLRWHDEHLVSVTTATLEDQYDKLQRPEGAVSAVPGLRQMRILVDKTGEIEALKTAAQCFEWSSLQASAHEYASHELLGYAEEVHKIMNGLRQAEEYLLIYALHGLAVGLTQAVAVYKGILSESENTYWRQVQRAVGDHSAWTQQHRIVLGLLIASPRARAEAGLRFYRETAALLDAIILPQHRATIDATLKRIAHFVE